MTSDKANTMQDSYNYLCSYENVAPEQEEPELATNAEWRGIMARARKEYGLSQTQIAEKLGVSQALVSKIENGETKSSTLIMPICRLLGIPPPEHFVDEFEKDWVQLGRALRNRSQAQAKHILELVESMVKDHEELVRKIEEEKPAQPQGKPKK